MTFNKRKYDIEYRKKKKKQFTVDLNIDEYDELVECLKKHNLTKVGLVRNALRDLKSANIEE